MDYGQHFNVKETPQSEKIPGSKQVANSAGGFAFAVDDWVRLDRFLILGSEGGSYYATEKKLTKESSEAVLRCLKADGARTVARIVEISDLGRAPKNDPAIFALAMAAGLGDAETKVAALEALPKVCRIGTHLFHFAQAVEGFRGWGRGLRRAVGAWYLAKTPEQIALQLAKYQQRDGWSHRDLLRLSSPKSDKAATQAMFRWAVGAEPSERKVTRRVGKEERIDKYPAVDEGLLPKVIVGFKLAQQSKEAKPRDAAKIIADYELPRECVPTEWLKHAEVWEALLVDMPMTAMIRNLGNMSKIGLVAPNSDAAKKVCKELVDVAKLKKARVHPVTVLMALRTYASGRGLRGHGEWTAVPQVVDALDDAFYLAFDAVEPTGKRWMLGLDVSGSMASPVAGTAMSCCEGATALALVTAHTEQDYLVGRFNQGYETCPFTKKTRLDEALKHTQSINGGGTDCSLPMVMALEKKWKFDVFTILTDSETWAGKIHPVQALRRYRDKMGIAAKLIVVGMVSNGFSIADPDDGGMLDVVGFDTAVPQLMADFSR